MKIKSSASWTQLVLTSLCLILKGCVILLEVISFPPVFIRPESQNFSLIHELQNGCVSRHENCESHCTSLSELLVYQVHCQSEIFCFLTFFCVVCWSSNLNGGLKIFIKSCCQQMCCHPGSAGPFIEHRQSRYSLILKSPRVQGMVNELQFQLSVTSCIST